jgi:hypothetical protein
MSWFADAWKKHPFVGLFALILVALAIFAAVLALLLVAFRDWALAIIFFGIALILLILGFFMESIWLLVVLGIGLLLIWSAYNNVRQRRDIMNLPTSTVRSIAMGLVELKGTVDADTKYSAPISGKPCAWYRAGIERRVGKNTDFFLYETPGSIFLKDATGRVEIETANAVIMGAKAETAVQDSSQLTPAQKALLEKMRLRVAFGDTTAASSIAKGGWGSFRYYEETLPVGEPLYALGTATRKPGAATTNADGIIIKPTALVINGEKGALELFSLTSAFIMFMIGGIIVLGVLGYALFSVVGML